MLHIDELACNESHLHDTIQFHRSDCTAMAAHDIDQKDEIAILTDMHLTM